jgi:hypothetical protein
MQSVISPITSLDAEFDWSDTQDDFEAAATTRFQRFSMPYERVEIEPTRESLRTMRRRPSTVAHTIRRPSDRDSAWFDLPEAALVAIEEPARAAPIEPLRWIAVSLAAGALALPLLWLLCRALPSLLTT